jgi:hypothetical protein
MGRIAKGILHEDDTTPSFLELFQEQPLMRITTGESIWRENNNCLKFAQARLVPETVEGGAV